MVDGKVLCMEVDTGASSSILSKSTFDCIWPGRTLQATTTQLTTYTGQKLHVLGSVLVMLNTMTRGLKIYNYL